MTRAIDLKSGQQETHKTCSKCRESKPFCDFYKSKKERFGVMSHCKICDKKKGAEYYLKNSEAVRERTNAAKKADPERHKEQNRNWYLNNKEKNNERGRKFREENPEKQAEYSRKWVEKDPVRARELSRLRCERRRKTPKGRLENTIRSGFYRGLKDGGKAGRKTFEILGYTPPELMAHLEKLFTEGMSWDNHGFGNGCWHVDHVVPLSVFNYETPDDIDFKRAWSLRNLTPLWSFENLTKGAKLSKAFQPSLTLSIKESN